MRATLVLLAALSAAAGGCAEHHKLVEPVASLLRSGVVDDPVQAARIEKLTDKDIAALLDVRVRPHLPTAVAVAALRSRCDGYQPYLARLDAEELGAWEKLVGGQALLRGVHPVSPLTHPSNKPTVHSLRTAAARMGCELLLVYLRSDSSVSNFNDAAALYWTLVGLWLAPGNTLEHKTVMQAAVVDCRTGMILGTATGDRHLRRDCPAVLEQPERAKLAREAPKAALADLQKGCAALMKRVVEIAVAARP